MTTISDLSPTEIEKLIKISGSSHSDNFFFRCNLVSTNTFFNSVMQSLIGWTSFNFVGDAVIITLFVLPIIFSFNAHGKQRKMQKLYLNIRCRLLKFFVMMTIGLSSTPIVASIIGQESPCVQRVESNLVSFGAKYQIPAFNVVFAAIMAFFMFTSSKSGSKTFISDWKSTASYACDKYFLKAASILLVVFFMTATIVYGKISVAQSLFSVCFGLTVAAVVELLQVRILLIIEIVLAICLCFFAGFNKRRKLLPMQYNSFMSLCFSAINYVIYSEILVINFVISNRDVNFKNKFSDMLKDDVNDGEDGEACFAEIDSQNESNTDISDILNRDMKDSTIAISIKIFGDLIFALLQEFT